MKKLKTLLLVLVIIPCVFFMTACTKSINVSEYKERVNTAGNNYYHTIEDKSNDFGYSYIRTTTKSYEKKVKFTDDKGEEQQVSKPFEDKDEVVQVFEKDGFEDESGNIRQHLKVTTTETNTKKGYKTTSDGLNVEAYETVGKKITTYTFISNFDTIDGIGDKVYKSEVTYKDGVEDKSIKNVFTYSEYISARMNGDINLILNKVYDNILKDKFFSSSAEFTTDFALMGNIDYFEKDVDAYGYVFNYITSTIGENKDVNYYESNATIEFADDLPYSIDISTLNKTNKYFKAEDFSGEENVQTVVNGSVKFKYSCDEILVPEGFESAVSWAFDTNQVTIYGLSIK